MNNKITVAIICKDEEKRIRRCLESVKWANEIVVVDSGSTDNTLDIAREYTDKIYLHTDWKGFGLQRQVAEDKASNDWILAIDSDEVLSDELQDEVQNQLESLNEDDVYRFNRLTYFCGKFIRHSGWYPDRIVRLYNKRKYHYNDADVHESVDCAAAKKLDFKADLYHYTVDSLEQYIDKRNSYAKAWAQKQYGKKKRSGVFQILVRPVFAFIRHYFLRLGIFDGYHGFLISVIQMQYTFNKYNYLRFKNK